MPTKKPSATSAAAYADYKRKSDASKAKGTTANRTFPNREAALDNAKRLVASHQISRSIFADIERETAKRK